VLQLLPRRRSLLLLLLLLLSGLLQRRCPLWRSLEASRRSSGQLTGGGPTVLLIIRVRSK
jgi:hypothetical protein